MSLFGLEVGKSVRSPPDPLKKADKEKADKEKAGWGIAFSEFIARAGVGLDGAEEMDATTMQL